MDNRISHTDRDRNQVPPMKLEPADPSVVSELNFGNFLEDEKSRLRDRFVPKNLFDRFASSPVVRSTLEQIWSEKFDWEDVKKEVLRLEKRKMELGLKFDGLKPEIEHLLFWRILAWIFWDSNIIRQKEDMRKLLRELELGHYQLQISRQKIRSPLNMTTFENDRGLEQLEKRTSGKEPSITGDFQLLLVKRQREAIQNNAVEYEEFQSFFKEKVEPIEDFITEWNGWLNKVEKRIQGILYPLLRVSFLILILAVVYMPRQC